MFSLRPIQNREYQNKCELETHNLLFSLTKRLFPSILTVQLMSAAAVVDTTEVGSCRLLDLEIRSRCIGRSEYFCFPIIYQLQTVYGVRLSLDIPQHREPVEKSIECENSHQICAVTLPTSAWFIELHHYAFKLCAKFSLSLRNPQIITSRCVKELLLRVLLSDSSVIMKSRFM